MQENYKYNDFFYYVSGERHLQVADSGFNYGLGAGYDFMLAERVVAGIEATLDFSTAKNCLNGFHIWEDLCLKAGRDIGLGVRAGGIITPQVLLFVKAGYANGRIKASGWDVVHGRRYSEAQKRGGARVGGGLEVLVSSRIFLKAEYTYTDYGNWSEYFQDGSIFISDARLGFDRHKTLAMVGMRF